MNRLARCLVFAGRRHSLRLSATATHLNSKFPQTEADPFKLPTVCTASLFSRNFRRFSDSAASPPPPRPPSPFPDPSPETVNANAESDETKSSDSSSTQKNEENKDFKNDHIRVLDAALHHVPSLGWSEAAMVAGAKELGFSPSIVGMFPRKEAALVEHFMDECLQKLVHEVDSHAEELSNLVLRARLARIIRIRLEMQIPYISKWSQALSIQAYPMNLPTSFKQRAVLMDEIWHSAGDRSTDIDWYVKRTLLGGIYSATELYMLTDYSPGTKSVICLLGSDFFRHHTLSLDTYT
eukprot:TRINITY_DN3164_c0_g1_i1.p1 TRINITY_DN3164_c0_g1~~TRINITY_DN3164_c0_g1_i1.p1  ORF type:complete len:295 (-),score=41.75 TRINITY_DN3164_c0_g1_i1:49-933(-)